MEKTRKARTLKLDTFKTSEEWFMEIYPDNEVEITEPKGWDKDNFKESYYEERISKSEFNMRILLSEVNYESTKR